MLLCGIYLIVKFSASGFRTNPSIQHHFFIDIKTERRKNDLKMPTFLDDIFLKFMFAIAYLLPS